ncbi:hypothetical protein ACLB1N_34840 [Escherichia coli]
MENAKMNSLIAQYPLVKDLVALKETTWFNPGTTSLAEGLPYVGLTEQDVQDPPMRAYPVLHPIWQKHFLKLLPLGGLLNQNWLPFQLCKNGWKKNISNRSAGNCY